MKTIKKRQKPIDKDIHLKYRCKKCGIDHWLSLREASTKNFLVVCTCGHTFKVRQVSDCVVKYVGHSQKKQAHKPQKVQTAQESKQDCQPIQTSQIPKPVDITPSNIPPVVRPTIPNDLLDKTVKLLLTYGFTQVEAKELIISTYNKVPVNDYAALIRYALQSLGDNNVTDYK